MHQIEDNTVPAHVHDDPHPNLFADIMGGLDDDSYHVWMDDLGSDANAPAHAALSDGEKAFLKILGPLSIPAVDPDGLHWLLYSTNQIADHFASDDFAGDDSDPFGYMAAELAALPARPVTREQLENNDGCSVPVLPLCPSENNDANGDLTFIRQFSYMRGIRAVASLYQLFQQATRSPSLVVVIDRVRADQDDEGLDEVCSPEVLGQQVCVGDSPDFFARVSVNGYESRNRGDRIDNQEDISPAHPHWQFGNTVGVSGTAGVQIGIWDHDGLYDDIATTRGGDDQSDVDNDGGTGDQTLDLSVDIGVHSP
ncbi:hypothetical protein AYO38_11715 [bacterium SCGC AG-212-C10]|nr:hypothetical protein AYO38_11715 [bacterium SCGC AG-212-C10]